MTNDIINRRLLKTNFNGVYSVILGRLNMSVELRNVLKKIANIQDIKNYDIYLDENMLSGDGFFSVANTGYVRDDDTGQVIHAYIKHLPGLVGTSIYFNEYQFYSNIWPELNKFQKEKCVETPFTNITEFYCGSYEPGGKYICMENLKIQKFDLLDKSKFIEEDILKLIFEKYGKFHALSFAFKDQKIEKYTELVSPLRYIDFGKDDTFLSLLTDCFNAAYLAVEEIDPENAKKITRYAENVREYYHNSKVYNGQFSGLIHGDCWSNNLLFKREENGIMEDIKFIDFQICRDSTPIDDLSYFFYSGASGDDFEKLDEYLEIYHKSFADFAAKLGSDTEKLLPLNILKSEWKRHSLFGILMAVLLWQIKLMDKDEIKKITAEENEERNIVKTSSAILESEEFKKNSSNILIHAIKYGILE